MPVEIYKDENSEYLRNNPTWHVEDSSWKAVQILKMIEKNNINAKTVAEVGCGAGEILNNLYYKMPEDIHFVGYDISIDAIRLARQLVKPRFDFKNENFTDIDIKFDLLLMVDVFEHVDNYIGFLKQCRDKAKNTIFHIPLEISVLSALGNKLVFSRKQVGHLHYFMKDTALATLVDSGYEVIDYFYTSGSLDLPLKKLKTRLAYLPRKIMYTLNQDFTSRVFGGFSLLVLTK